MQRLVLVDWWGGAGWGGAGWVGMGWDGMGEGKGGGGQSLHLSILFFT